LKNLRGNKEIDWEYFIVPLNDDYSF
jgi:hypothetical protein